MPSRPWKEKHIFFFLCIVSPSRRVYAYYDNTRLPIINNIKYVIILARARENKLDLYTARGDAQGGPEPVFNTITV